MKERNRVTDAIWTAFTEALRFVVVPLVLVDLVRQHYPQLATAFMTDIETFVLFFGGMIAAASTLEAYYRPGTYKRLLFGLTAIGFLCMWFFVIFGGGVAEIDFGPFFFHFDMSKIVYIILFGMSLKGLLILQTFSVSRRAEEERARKSRVEQAKAKRVREKARAKARAPPPPPSPFSFADMSKTEFEVTADDSVGFAQHVAPRPVPEGMKACEICGTKAPLKDYVCRNCGAWFPKDSDG